MKNSQFSIFNFQFPALLALLALLFTGCGTTTPQAKAYYTLADIKAVVDRAERVYGREVVAGRVTPAAEKTTDELIVKFHGAYLVAVRAARADYSTPASPDLQRLADALVALIYTFADPIPPPPPARP